MNEENVMNSNDEEVFTIEFPKRYMIDMDKVNSIEDVEVHSLSFNTKSIPLDKLNIKHSNELVDLLDIQDTKNKP